MPAEGPSGIMAGDTSREGGWSGCAGRQAPEKTAGGLPAMDGHRVLLAGEFCDDENKPNGLGSGLKGSGWRPVDEDGKGRSVGLSRSTDPRDND